MNTSIFKSYDVRGLYPEEVNLASVAIVARSAARRFDNGPIVIAYDGRHGSPELAQQARETLQKEMVNLGKNFSIEFIGLSSTPMFYFLVNALNASGGLMITASHNPKEYNGVKIVGKGAIPIGGTELKEIAVTLHPDE